ncbi:hypothetical protein chiPu_0027654 [Chiloscyllium punctatum]|uniref:Uncharacterized protein n=1 Tax=Chiloscyllium punctatum TaxID=137246 RepID=A0A401TLM1_CHIPU|nr:hypothetical protein [Chiloscyllium punctatum]
MGCGSVWGGRDLAVYQWEMGKRGAGLGCGPMGCGSVRGRDLAVYGSVRVGAGLRTNGVRERQERRRDPALYQWDMGKRGAGQARQPMG